MDIFKTAQNLKMLLRLSANTKYVIPIKFNSPLARNPQVQTNVNIGNVTTVVPSLVSYFRPNTFTHTQSNINTLFLQYVSITK
jgi:hypothetical protein